MLYFLERCHRNLPNFKTNSRFRCAYYLLPQCVVLFWSWRCECIENWTKSRTANFSMVFLFSNRRCFLWDTFLIPDNDEADLWVTYLHFHGTSERCFLDWHDWISFLFYYSSNHSGGTFSLTRLWYSMLVMREPLCIQHLRDNIWGVFLWCKENQTYWRHVCFFVAGTLDSVFIDT